MDEVVTGADHGYSSLSALIKNDTPVTFAMHSSLLPEKYNRAVPPSALTSQLLFWFSMCTNAPESDAVTITSVRP